MNAYILLAAYRLSVKAAATLAIVRTGQVIELQMRGCNGDLFQRLHLTDLR